MNDKTKPMKFEDWVMGKYDCNAAYNKLVYAECKKAWDGAQAASADEIARLKRLLENTNRLGLEAIARNSPLHANIETLKQEIDLLKAALEECHKVFRLWDGGGVTSGHYFALMDAKKLVGNALTAAYGKPKADGELPSAIVGGNQSSCGPEWTCTQCGRIGDVHQIKTESMDGVEYELECPECECAEIAESPKLALRDMAKRMEDLELKLEAKMDENMELRADIQELSKPTTEASASTEMKEK